MVDGKWKLKIGGLGKVYPCTDEESIDELVAAFIQAVKGKGHKEILWALKKTGE